MIMDLGEDLPPLFPQLDLDEQVPNLIPSPPAVKERRTPKRKGKDLESLKMKTRKVDKDSTEKKDKLIASLQREKKELQLKRKKEKKEKDKLIASLKEDKRLLQLKREEDETEMKEKDKLIVSLKEENKQLQLKLDAQTEAYISVLQHFLYDNRNLRMSLQQLLSLPVVVTGLAYTS